MKVSQERYLELAKTLTDQELECFEKVKEKTITIYGVEGTSCMDDMIETDYGDEYHIYESFTSGHYVIPLEFDSLDSAKTFCIQFFGSY